MGNAIELVCASARRGDIEMLDKLYIAGFDCSLAVPNAISNNRIDVLEWCKKNELFKKLGQDHDAIYFAMFNDKIDLFEWFKKNGLVGNVSKLKDFVREDGNSVALNWLETNYPEQ